MSFELESLQCIHFYFWSAIIVEKPNISNMKIILYGVNI